jgi:hypothetical protein
VEPLLLYTPCGTSSAAHTTLRNLFCSTHLVEPLLFYTPRGTSSVLHTSWNPFCCTLLVEPLFKDTSEAILKDIAVKSQHISLCTIIFKSPRKE